MRQRNARTMYGPAPPNRVQCRAMFPGFAIELSQFRLLRMVRLVRVLRLLRVVRFCSDLRIMVNGIAGWGKREQIGGILVPRNKLGDFFSDFFSAQVCENPFLGDAAAGNCDVYFRSDLHAAGLQPLENGSGDG